jgi:hypothetical protein
MSDKQVNANRRNARMSRGPTSRIGRQRSARNAFKHGLSVPTDPANEDVRVLAALLSPTTATDHVTALAVEAARRIIDLDRVTGVRKHLYSRLGMSPILAKSPKVSQAGLGVLDQLAAELIRELQPPTAEAFTLSDLAIELNRLARYERRALSLRDRALRELTEGITREGLVRD